MKNVQRKKTATNSIPAKKLAKARLFNKISGWITRKTGSPVASISAFAVIILWALCGPLFDFSDTWQLVINTGTTIITFLMVFIIQQSQNKDTAAIQMKLNELIACNEKASNRLVDIEDLTEEEILLVKNFYIKLAEKAEEETNLHTSHSLDEVDTWHSQKQQRVSKKNNAEAEKS
jgi:low affinity Fe/Cu permease